MTDKMNHEPVSVREVRWERMFPDELEAAFAARPLVYLPQGLCEPHGPQNALGLDALKAHAICCAAARAHGGIVAPAEWWHVHEVGAMASWAHDQIGQARPWLTAFPPWLHFKNVAYQMRAFDALGFHACIILTGHYGPNWLDLRRLVELLQPHMPMRMHGLPDFEVNLPGFDDSGKGSGDHAGRVETSLLWALEPDCVDISRLPPKDAPRPQFAMGPNAYDADRRVGERMVRDEVAGLDKIARRLLDEYTRSAPADRKPLSFMDIERIWRDVVVPELPQFSTIKPSPPHRPSPPTDSRWSLNFAVPDGVM